MTSLSVFSAHAGACPTPWLNAESEGLDLNGYEDPRIVRTPADCHSCKALPFRLPRFGSIADAW